MPTTNLNWEETVKWILNREDEMDHLLWEIYSKPTLDTGYYHSAKKCFETNNYFQENKVFSGKKTCQKNLMRSIVVDHDCQ